MAESWSSSFLKPGWSRPATHRDKRVSLALLLRILSYPIFIEYATFSHFFQSKEPRIYTQYIFHLRGQSTLNIWSVKTPIRFGTAVAFSDQAELNENWGKLCFLFISFFSEDFFMWSNYIFYTRFFFRYARAYRAHTPLVHTNLKTILPLLSVFYNLF